MPKIMLLKKMKQRAPPLDTIVTVEREQGDRGAKAGKGGAVSMRARKGPTRSRDTGRGAVRKQGSVVWGGKAAAGGSGSKSYLAGRTVPSTCWRLLLRRARSDQGGGP